MQGEGAEVIPINSARRGGKTQAVENWRQRHEQVEATPVGEVDISDMQNAATEMSRAAIRDPEIMKLWNETFPGICPGCFKPHALMSHLITKGLCAKCRLKLSKAIKQLAPQE